MNAGNLSNQARLQLATAANYVEEYYLAANPDVAEAVRQGRFARARDHFDLIGHSENRYQERTGAYTFPFTTVRSDDLPSFADLSEEYPDDRVPPLDRSDVDESKLSWDQLHWRRFGYLVLPGFIPEALTREYLAYRDRSGVGLGGFENSVHGGTSPHILNIGCYKPLADKIVELFGEDLIFNFTLTQFTSTQRDWHQDDYLGSPESFARYCAAWIAMDDVHPDSGPFEFVSGSHRWPGLRGHLVKQYLVPEARNWVGQHGEPAHWGTLAEPYTTPALDAEIARQGVGLQRFQARRGDLLLWHGKLVHRGTRAAVPGMRRPSLICHYYPADETPDREIVRHNGGGIHFRSP